MEQSMQIYSYRNCGVNGKIKYQTELVQKHKSCLRKNQLHEMYREPKS